MRSAEHQVLGYSFVIILKNRRPATRPTALGSKRPSSQHEMRLGSSGRSKDRKASRHSPARLRTPPALLHSLSQQLLDAQREQTNLLRLIGREQSSASLRMLCLLGTALAPEAGCSPSNISTR